ncbi:MAG: class I SAM-dependent methyltransferase [Eubacteriales bacterium]|nr:class I SAM-dependent methyltransferase [Eubacteriales bacterium]
MKTSTSLDPRLRAAAGYVRQGAVLADIGCDHALLPVFLLKCGRIRHAICADIAEGPLCTAKKNVEKNAFSDKVSIIQTNGLCGLDTLGITDITICGMGGELIASIIDEAEFLHDSSIRIILQPMSRLEKLRSYLWENGFCIEDETYCLSGGKTYCCICAHYTGGVYTYSDIEAELGKIFPKLEASDGKDENPENVYYYEHVKKSIERHKKAALGLKKAGIPCKQHEDFTEIAERILSTRNGVILK